MSNKELEMKAREHDISDISPEVIIEATEAAAVEVTVGYKKIENGVVTGYKKIESGVVTGYKKIEDGVVEGFGKVVDKCAGVMLNEDGSMKTGKMGETVVNGYKKIENAFVNTFMAKEGETVDEAKARIAAQQHSRDEKMKADAEAREAAQKARIEESLAASRNAGKRN